MRQAKVAATAFIRRVTRPKKKSPKPAEQHQTKQKAPSCVYFVYPMPKRRVLETAELEDVVALCLTHQISIRKGATTLNVHRTTVSEAMRRYRHAVCGSAPSLSLWAERCGLCASVAVAVHCVHCIDNPQ